MAITKVSRGLLSTGVSDSSDATAITIDSNENVLIGTTSGSDPLVVSDSGASSITARFINTNADANPANIRLQKLSGSPADDDYIGMINVSGENDASEETIFQSIDFISTDVSDGTEDGVIAFRTRGAGTLAERLRITEQGFIKLPSKVSFTGTGDAGLGHHTNNYMYIYGGTAGLILQDNSSGSNRILIRDSGTMEFQTGDSEQMRLDNSGALLVGTTSHITATTEECVHIKNGDGAGQLFLDNTRSSGSQFMVQIYRLGTRVGSIQTTTTTTSYLTTSDYRVKENVDYDFNALERVAQLKPARFNFTIDPDVTVDGFLAHEVSDIVPEAITGEKDAVKEEEYEITPAELNDDGDIVTEAVMGTREVPDYQGIDQSKLVPLLTKAIQELSAKVEELQSEINTLKGE